MLTAAGAMLVAPLVQAQRPQRPVRIGVLAQVFSAEGEFWAPLFAELARLGWKRESGLVLEVRRTQGDPKLAATFARELAEARVDLILALSTAAAVAARQASETIPIVTWCGYPVEAGLAASLARPGGNVTGIANYANAEVWGKFVELLREVRPEARELGVLWDYAPPAFPDGLIPLPAIEQAAAKLGMRSRVWISRTTPDLVRALDEVERSPVQVLVISLSGGIHFLDVNIPRINGLIAGRRLPAITDIATAQTPAMGFLMAYSPNVAQVQGRLASLINQVLRGANPASLPFELPAKFDLALYAKSAAAIGLSIPQSLLLRAERVIE
jgi:putative ABC transport system substrate-binding protein